MITPKVLLQLTSSKLLPSMLEAGETRAMAPKAAGLCSMAQAIP